MSETTAMIGGNLKECISFMKSKTKTMRKWRYIELQFFQYKGYLMRAAESNKFPELSDPNA